MTFRLYNYSHVNALDYKDIYIVPQYTEIATRKLVDTSSEMFPGLKIDVSICSANMDTITDGNFAASIARAGAIGVIHRFMSIEKNCYHYSLATQSVVGIAPNQKVEEHPCLVSIGVNGEGRERASELYKVGARYFVLDIAHGDSLMMKNMIEWMRKEFSDIFIMAGNVATRIGTEHLINWGVDAVKVGIGPGIVCLTKNITGCTCPQVTAITECVEAAREYEQKAGKKITIIADGGLTEYGDIAKSLGLGADFVMSGRLFASCLETPGPRVNGKKVYRGSASRDCMLLIKNEDELPTPEGMSTLIEYTATPVANVIKDIKGALQSAFSYSNARNLKEFQESCMFGIRHSRMY